jgi:hypothetical protein
MHLENSAVPVHTLELAWTYTVDVRAPFDRGDLELARAFYSSVRAVLRRIAPDLQTTSEYIAVEVRRGYRSVDDRLTAAYAQLIGTNVTDLGDVWRERNSSALRDALRDELIIVAALLRALAEAFTPAGIGGYRPVDTA